MDKIIHYCWFGGKKKPLKIRKCIKSWKKFFPDYEIKEWNESNFDIHCCPYVEEAYQSKKWAFVSDYCRFWALEKYGGIYFDTDVKILKRFDNIVKIPFLAIEKSDNFQIAPGLCCGFEKHDKFLLDMINAYNLESYFTPKTICFRTTEYFEKIGFVHEDKLQIINGYCIYSSDYFCPIDYRDYSKHYSKNTVCEHLYLATWAPLKVKLKITMIKFKAFWKRGKSNEP